MTRKSAYTDHVIMGNHSIDEEIALVLDRVGDSLWRRIEEATWIRKTLLVMMTDERSYNFQIFVFSLWSIQ